MDKDEIARMFPDVIRIAREVRKEFGDGVKLTYIECNCGNFLVGKKVPVDPDNVVSLADMVEWGTFVPDHEKYSLTNKNNSSGACRGKR